MRRPHRYPALAATLLLACAPPATVQHPEAPGPGVPAESAAPAAPATLCQYWGTYAFFYFAERETVAACLEAGKDPRARVDELGRTPLHNAARAWKESFMRDLLAVGVDVNARDWLGRTPLHDAADWVRPVEPDATDVVFTIPFSVDGGPAVAALLEHGADVGARDVRGNTPLHLTWRDLPPGHAYVWDPYEDIGAAPQLLAAGADPSARNDRGRIASPGDCRNWHQQIFARAAVPPSEHYRFFGYLPLSDPISATYAKCVTAGADLSARDGGGHTVLHHAAAFADTSAIALLLEAGAEAGARTRDGATPLHMAARAGNADIATRLLEWGANVNVGDNGGTTPLHFAVRNGSLATVHALLDAGADANALDAHGTALHAGRSAEDRVAIVDALLEAGVDVNLVGEEFATTLLMESVGVMWGDSSGQLALRFLRRGADPNARNSIGGTALHQATHKGPDVYRVLLDAGADPTAVDDWGRSPLHHVAGFGEQAVIPMLVEAGADLDLLDGNGRAPLHLAIEHFEENVAHVGELLEAGADPSLRTESGDTPLHLAVGSAPWPESGIGSVVEMLVAAGADVNARNARGETPVELAWLAGRSAVVDRLVALGAEWVEPVAEPAEFPGQPVRQGAAPVQPTRTGGLQALLCDLSAGDYANYGSPFKFPLESVAGCLAAGTSPDRPRRDGQPPLFWLPAGSIELLELLLDAGAEVGARDDAGFTPLHWVARAWRGGADYSVYSVAAARALVQAGADADARGPGGRSPLHMAAAARPRSPDAASTEMITLLVQAGAGVNARTDSGETPLHLAANSPAVALRLLELGADREARDDSGRVADPVSCENFGGAGYFALADRELAARCIGTLTRGGGDPLRDSGLHMAAGHARDPGVIHTLLQAGALLDGRDGEGYTPLHRAAATGEPAVIQALLEAGADANRRVETFGALNPWDPRDWTPLHLAAGNRDARAVALILEAGGDVHARVEGYETPLHIAAANENPEVASLLLKARGDVNAREAQGRTPLHVAALGNPNPAVSAVLIKAGADLEARAMHGGGHVLRGLTPMYLAAMGTSNPEVVSILAEAGAEVDAQRAELRPDHPFWASVSHSGLHRHGDLGHNSPLHLAALFNRTPGVLEALVRAGADLELRNRSGQTALHMAALHNPAVFPTLLALGADSGVVDDEGNTPMDHARFNKTLHGLPEVRRFLVGGG